MYAVGASIYLLILLHTLLMSPYLCMSLFWGASPILPRTIHEWHSRKLQEQEERRSKHKVNCTSVSTAHITDEPIYCQAIIGKTRKQIFGMEDRKPLD